MRYIVDNGFERRVASLVDADQHVREYLDECAYYGTCVPTMTREELVWDVIGWVAETQGATPPHGFNSCVSVLIERIN